MSGPFPLGSHVVQLAPDGSSQTIRNVSGPGPRLPGVQVGAPTMDGDPPHRGECHPDGDELLYVVSGRAQVILDDGDRQTVGTEQVFELQAGDAFVVPRAAWHRVHLLERTHLVHFTPGPGSDHRPL